MSCLALNCRGSGNLRTGRELVEIVWAKDPYVVFLAETLIDEASLEVIQRSIDLTINGWFQGREGVVVWCSTGRIQSI